MPKCPFQGQTRTLSKAKLAHVISKAQHTNILFQGEQTIRLQKLIFKGIVTFMRISFGLFHK